MGWDALTTGRIYYVEGSTGRCGAGWGLRSPGRTLCENRSLATVHEHVQVLIGKGYLRNERGRSWALQVLSEEEWAAGDPEPEKLMIEDGVTAEDVRCAQALLDLVEESAVEPALRDEAIRVVRELLGPGEMERPGPLVLIGAGRQRLRRRSKSRRGETVRKKKPRRRTGARVSQPTRSAPPCRCSADLVNRADVLASKETNLGTITVEDDEVLVGRCVRLTIGFHVDRICLHFDWKFVIIKSDSVLHVITSR